MDRARYPADWRAISWRIRERAGQRCEWPGCGVANGAIVERAPGRRIRIVLTVAHRCHDPACADETHLAAWCQAHHLRYDAALHAQHAAETRRQKRRAAGQQELWG